MEANIDRWIDRWIKKIYIYIYIYTYIANNSNRRETESQIQRINRWLMDQGCQGDEENK